MDGQVSHPVLARPTTAIRAGLWDSSVLVVSVEQAPEWVSGVMALRVRLPEGLEGPKDLSAVPFYIEVGGTRVRQQFDGGSEVVMVKKGRGQAKVVRW